MKHCERKPPVKAAWGGSLRVYHLRAKNMLDWLVAHHRCNHAKQNPFSGSRVKVFSGKSDSFYWQNLEFWFSLDPIIRWRLGFTIKHPIKYGLYFVHLEFLQDSFFVESILCLCVTGLVRQETPNFVLCTFVPILLVFAGNLQSGVLFSW